MTHIELLPKKLSQDLVSALNGLLGHFSDDVSKVNKVRIVLIWQRDLLKMI
jgi:hypothetical protein